MVSAVSSSSLQAVKNLIKLSRVSSVILFTLIFPPSSLINTSQSPSPISIEYGLLLGVQGSPLLSFLLASVSLFFFHFLILPPLVSFFCFFGNNSICVA